MKNFKTFVLALSLISVASARCAVTPAPAVVKSAACDSCLISNAVSNVTGAVSNVVIGAKDFFVDHKWAVLAVVAVGAAAYYVSTLETDSDI